MENFNSLSSLYFKYNASSFFASFLLKKYVMNKEIMIQLVQWNAN